MRVAACTSDGNLRIERRPVPLPGPGEVVLRLTWCGFCGTDLFKLDNQTQTPGTVLGHELVGIVQETGDGVTALEIGDRVVAPHHVACGRCGLCRRGSRTLCSVFKENLMSPGGFRSSFSSGSASSARRHVSFPTMSPMNQQPFWNRPPVSFEGSTRPRSETQKAVP